MIKFDYNDLLWNDNLEKPIKIPDLQPGDILLIPGETRYFFWDYFGFALSFVATLAVIAATDNYDKIIKIRGMKMNNLNFDIDKYLLGDSKSLKDYILLIRINLIPFFIISFVITIAGIIYAIWIEDIYKSTVTMKITKQQQSVLDSSAPPELHDLALDRFISNEIEIMNNYDTRERNAKALIDSFNISKEKKSF